MKKIFLILAAAVVLSSCASKQTKLLDVYELDYTIEDIVIKEMLISGDPEVIADAREYLKYRLEERGMEATEENILQAAREVMDKFTRKSELTEQAQPTEETQAPASASLFAKESFTVREFSETEISSERSVKIIDSLDEETQRALVSACYKLQNKVALDLSECGFGADEAKIDFFHIRNVRSCVLPKATKFVVNLDCADLEEVVLNDGLEEIAAQAFFESGLKSVCIPPSVRYVGACAFGDCPALKFIRTDEKTDSGSWSVAWTAWNEAKIISGGDYEETESGREENPNKIEFDHEVYYLLGGKMNMKIRLASPLQKTQKAKLYFYDAHNGNSEQGCLEVKVKKRKAEIEVKNFDASQIGIADTDLFRAIFDECGDYWVKVECVLELADGTRIPLDGSARLYFAGMPGL